MKGRAGKVYFVGAGPGDPKLITVKGAELLAQADVIIYDRLVNLELLNYGKKEAHRIYCGKTPNYPSISQEEINEIIVEHALEGKAVVRLKGGDPTVFGRVGEEASFCLEHGISYEIVPGITSGIAAPTYAGIPLTHREFSSSFAVVTGQKRKDHDPKGDEIRWEGLAKAVDTLVFYMGVKNLPYIRENLLLHGRDQNTPVALVRWGTYDHQETLVGKLHNIVELVEARNFQSPAIIVVGEVVSLREKLAWFEEEGNQEILLKEAMTS
ncbi:uroporphyrin-III C-methyltransferase/uroporphyrinogen III methyltransferase/synthase [Evansella vedderi]|uniref:uroporphyrinogen-III C-methyltransferase n=1 Tax=Evansella vedderi TaxID=38282 RepID=A0ABU0A070_9BACI|nr:uroporphyrinogen-III C-methyltransferase [Evansella vedderi]MDQ0256610.1 uroporphyrin-III C-methyltransferase/uroporphyrinogen III methyltransferase/synthase [Evansella vedderi]